MIKLVGIKSKSCKIIMLHETFLNHMWPRHSVSYLCQEYVNSKIAESVRDVMLVSIKFKVLSGLFRDSVIYSLVLFLKIHAFSLVRPTEK